MQHEDGRPSAFASVRRRSVDDEHPMARHVVVPTALLPRIDTNVTPYHRGIVSSAAVPVISAHPL
jgi:hypothetical protein